MPHDAVRNVMNSHMRDLFSRRNVVSVGVGRKTTNGQETEEVCIVVGVRKKVPESVLSSENVIPRTLGKCVTDVVEMGVLKALENTDRVRPAPGGVSIGHEDITAGTLGCLVTKNGETFILSNNHVLANSNSGDIGDAILQPGPHDGGTDADQIGILAEYATIEFEAGGGLPPIPPLPPECNIAMFVETVVNLFAKSVKSHHRVQAHRMGTPLAVNMVDAALAKPTSDDMVTAEVLGIGRPTGSASVALGDAIKKNGRTTEFTTGTVSQLHVTIQVQYGAGQIATFEDQIVSGIQSGGGDSGSAILNNNNEVVGLLFAGSDTSTIFNPIEHVLSAFGVTILV